LIDPRNQNEDHPIQSALFEDDSLESDSILSEPPFSQTLNAKCQSALEAWICEDPDRAMAEDHFESCASCRGLAESIQLDQELLRWQLSQIESPPVPRLLLREPLQAASGHPRRVSLSVIPFGIAIVLVLLLAVEFLIFSIAPTASLGLRTESRAQTLVEIVAELIPIPPSSSQSATRVPEDWMELIRAEVEKRHDLPADPEGRYLDAYGTPFRLELTSNNRWRIVSAGPNGQFGSIEEIDSDDLTATQR